MTTADPAPAACTRAPSRDPFASHAARRGPLDVAEFEFADLIRTRPRGVLLAGENIHPDLAGRWWGPDQLRDLVYDPHRAQAIKDSVWRALIGRARIRRGDWTTAVIGVGLPGMRADLAHLAYGYPGDPADLDAEMLTAFLQAAAPGGVDLDETNLLRLLCAPGRAAARRLRHADVRHLPIGGCPRSTRPPRPWGHPDLVLAHAVALGVITAADAAVIGQTRLEGISLATVAAATGEAVWTLQRRRHRAETDLAAAIHTGLDTHPPTGEHHAA